MSQITFDTLQYSNKLEKAGFTREQAEAMAEVNSIALQDMVAAKELATKGDLAIVKHDLEIKLAEAKHELEIKLAETKHDILRWMFGGFIAQTAFIVAALALLK